MEVCDIVQAKGWGSPKQAIIYKQYTFSEQEQYKLK